MKYIVIASHLKPLCYLSKFKYNYKKILFVGDHFLYQDCIINKNDANYIKNIGKAKNIDTRVWACGGVTYVQSNSTKAKFKYMIFKGKTLKQIKKQINNYKLLKEIL